MLEYWEDSIMKLDCISTMILIFHTNSLAPGRYGSNFKIAIPEHMFWIKFMSTSWEIALRWMPQNTFDDKSMAWCHQANIDLMLTQIYVAIWRH